MASVTTDPQPLLIGGARVAAETTLDVNNPYDGAVVGRVALADRSHFDMAFAKATETAAELIGWPSHSRHDLLAAIADQVRDHRQELARLISLESGKPIRDSRVEVDRDVFTFRYAAEEAWRIGGEVVPMDLAPKGERKLGITRRFPIGPVLGITPFNTPLNLVAHKIAPALAAGTPVVIKPDLRTPLVALRLAELILECGGPAGLVSVLPAPNEVTERAAMDERIPIVSFTGSAGVGWHLKSLLPRKRVVLELGNNSGVVVHSDSDIQAAAGACAVGAFNYAGQSCTAVQRIFVHAPVYRDFLDALVEVTKRFQLGNPLDETTDIGPMISDAAAKRADAWIAEARERGANVLSGGKREGAVLPPTIIVDADRQSRVVCEEVFAPIVSVEPYTDFERALREVDNTPYGLQAGVFTKDIERILHAFDVLHVGGLMINETAAYRVDHMPYGGVKESGAGREGLRYAIEEFTMEKFMVLGGAPYGQTSTASSATDNEQE